MFVVAIYIDKSKDSQASVSLVHIPYNELLVVSMTQSSGIYHARDEIHIMECLYSLHDGTNQCPVAPAM